MTSRRAIVRITQNFERNLETIHLYLEEREPSSAYYALLDLLFDKVIPTLETFPQIGFNFLTRTPRSSEALGRLRSLERRLAPGASVREYIAGDYLLLYLQKGERVDLLAIKHHRQLSFDLTSLWD